MLESRPQERLRDRAGEPRRPPGSGGGAGWGRSPSRRRRPPACRCPRSSAAGTAPSHDGQHARLELAELARRVDEDRVHGAHAAAHLVGRVELHQRAADHHAHHVERAEREERGQREPERAGHREHHRRDAEPRDGAVHGHSDVAPQGVCARATATSAARPQPAPRAAGRGPTDRCAGCRGRRSARARSRRRAEPRTDRAR